MNQRLPTPRQLHCRQLHCRQLKPGKNFPNQKASQSYLKITLKPRPEKKVDPLEFDILKVKIVKDFLAEKGVLKNATGQSYQSSPETNVGISRQPEDGVKDLRRVFDNQVSTMEASRRKVWQDYVDADKQATQNPTEANIEKKHELRARFETVDEVLKYMEETRRKHSEIAASINYGPRSPRNVSEAYHNTLRIGSEHMGRAMGDLGVQLATATLRGGQQRQRTF